MSDAALPPLPGLDGDHTLLVRTDFSDDAAWLRVSDAAREPRDDGFVAVLEPVDDRAYEGATAEQLAALAASSDEALLVFAADLASMSREDPTLLVVNADASDEEFGRAFRVAVAQAWGPENNVRLANMGFEEFADDADAHGGVHRGF